MTDEIFNKESLKEQLFHNGGLIGVFYNVADTLLKSGKLDDYWHIQTMYQTEHRILSKISFESSNDAKLHLELAPVTILNIDDENDGVEITLYDDTHNWDIHEYIMSQFKLTNLYTACSLPYSTSFEVEEEKTIRILHKVVIPVYEYSHDIVLRILNVIRMAEEYALKI